MSVPVGRDKKQGEVPAKDLHSSHPQSSTSQRSQIEDSRLALEIVGRSGHGAGTIRTRLAASSPALAFIFLEVGVHVCCAHPLLPCPGGIIEQVLD